MSIRPGRAKGPWVGLGGSGGASTFLALTDTPASYAGSGLYVVRVNFGETALEFVDGSTLFSGVEGQAINIDVLSDGTNEVSNGQPYIDDDFTASVLKPFWENTQMFTSGDWQFSAANDRLEGIAQNNARDIFREGVEGDYDIAFKYAHGGTTSVGPQTEGESIQCRLVYIPASNEITWVVSGESNITVSKTYAADFTFWLRIKRERGTISAYYKESDNDPWTLINSVDKEQGTHVTFYQDSATGGYIYRAILHDSEYGVRTRATSEKVIALTDAASIAVDASKGNIFDVTLGGNRTLSNPTGGIDGQKIMLRVRQDGTGSRTLSFDTKYRFSSALPSPTLSTAADALDYLGFIYNQADDQWDYIAQVFGF